MWNGVFVPRVTKSFAGKHTNNPSISIEEAIGSDRAIDVNALAEEEYLTLVVNFSHVCEWPGVPPTSPPSNSKTYYYLYPVEGIIDMDSRERNKIIESLNEELMEAHSAGKSMRWLIDALESGRVEIDSLRTDVVE